MSRTYITSNLLEALAFIQLRKHASPLRGTFDDLQRNLSQGAAYYDTCGKSKKVVSAMPAVKSSITWMHVVMMCLSLLSTHQVFGAVQLLSLSVEARYAFSRACFVLYFMMELFLQRKL